MILFLFAISFHDNGRPYPYRIRFMWTFFFSQHLMLNICKINSHKWIWYLQNILRFWSISCQSLSFWLFFFFFLSSLCSSFGKDEYLVVTRYIWFACVRTNQTQHPTYAKQTNIRRLCGCCRWLFLFSFLFVAAEIYIKIKYH